ncbi:MAG: N4-gp56 family major capsid protein [Fusobacteriales bacterium]|nr:MAG: N4-gp56 family major capsid protein [Fusobacteriales bacterium]
MANETRIADVVIPEVMADMVRTDLPHKLVFAPLLSVDTRLQGVPGNTITVPKWGLIGIAEEVAELGAIPYEKLTTSKTTMTIKKIGKGVHFSDEALLSGYGDPLGEGISQLSMAIARKIDADVLTELKKATLKVDKKDAALSYDIVADALTKFGEKINVPRVMFITPEQYAQLRKDEKFLALKDMSGKPILMSGAIGEICGVQLVVTANPEIVKGTIVTNLIVEAGAVALLLKRSPLIEKERDIDHKATKVNIDQHYGLYIKDDTKVMALLTKKPE